MFLQGVECCLMSLISLIILLLQHGLHRGSILSLLLIRVLCTNERKVRKWHKKVRRDVI